MKTLIFGDTHLSNKFNSDKYNKLQKIITNSDQVIINGDFWDRGFTTFDQFVNSEWNQLFSILKQKNAVYLYGNHDRKDFCNGEESQFSVKQGKEHEFQIKDKTVYVMHGDEPLYHWGVLPDFLEIYFWPISDHFERKKFLTANNIDEIKSLQGYNDKFKKYKSENYSKDSIAIYNHTHLQERDDETGCYNTGCMKYGFFQYITIENDEIVFHDERYKEWQN